MIGFSDYPKLISLLEEQSRQFDDYLAVTELLSASFENDDMEAIQKYIGQRQAIMDNTARLHQDTQLLTQSYTKCLDSVSEAEQTRVTELEDAIQQKLREILLLDASARKVGEDLILNIAGEAKQTKLSRKSLGAYNQTSMFGHVPGYFDKKQ